MIKEIVQRQSLTERYQAEFPTSRKLFEQARQVFPNGTTHDLRNMEPFAIYVDRALGARKWDVDGHELIDFWSGHGALLLGHSHPAVVEAVTRAMSRFSHPGGCHELEVEWGQLVQKLVPSAEKVRFVSSGTEATLMALRLARIHTGKPKVLKFAGHFHGWHDFLLQACDPPFDAIPPGVPEHVAADAVIIPPNDPEAVEKALKANPDIGCVILEATGGHFGLVPIRGDFLRALRDITTRHNRLLILDEVISGFRVHPGGAQAYYNVKPDMTTLAKILAGGLPGGCVVGRADILGHIDVRPGKPKMKHPGTFNANPLSAAAGAATLRLVADGTACERANNLAKLLRQKLNELFVRRELDWIAYGEFSAFKLIPGYKGPRSTADEFIPYNNDHTKLDAPKNTKLIHAFKRAMLLNGVDVSGLAGMTTSAHTEADIDFTVKAVSQAIDLLIEDKMI